MIHRVTSHGASNRVFGLTFYCRNYKLCIKKLSAWACMGRLKLSQRLSHKIFMKSLVEFHIAQSRTESPKIAYIWVFSSYKFAFFLYLRNAQNGVYKINTTSTRGYSDVYCQMTSLLGCENWGWTMVMKMDGTQVLKMLFDFS